MNNMLTMAGTDLVPYYSLRALSWRWGFDWHDFEFFLGGRGFYWGFSFSVPGWVSANQLAMALSVWASLPVLFRVVMLWVLLLEARLAVFAGLGLGVLLFLVLVALLELVLRFFGWLAFGLFGAVPPITRRLWSFAISFGKWVWRWYLYTSPPVWFWWFLKTTLLLALTLAKELFFLPWDLFLLSLGSLRLGSVLSDQGSVMVPVGGG
jgi:hypothetical protein